MRTTPTYLLGTSVKITARFNVATPTSVLVTGWDIIFFWVARMIIAGYAAVGGVSDFFHYDSRPNDTVLDLICGIEKGSV